MTAVLVVGTMDTKGRECAYLADRIRELGCEVVVMDVGILGEADEIRCDITRRAVAEAAGTTLEALRHAGSRGKAVEATAEGDADEADEAEDIESEDEQDEAA